MSSKQWFNSSYDTDIQAYRDAHADSHMQTDRQTDTRRTLVTRLSISFTHRKFHDEIVVKFLCLVDSTNIYVLQ